MGGNNGQQLTKHRTWIRQPARADERFDKAPARFMDKRALLNVARGGSFITRRNIVPGAGRESGLRVRKEVSLPGISARMQRNECE